MPQRGVEVLNLQPRDELCRMFEHFWHLSLRKALLHTKLSKVKVQVKTDQNLKAILRVFSYLFPQTKCG